MLEAIINFKVCNWLRKAVKAIQAANTHVYATFNSENGFTIATRDGESASVAFQIGREALEGFHSDSEVPGIWLATDQLSYATGCEREGEEERIAMVARTDDDGKTTLLLRIRNRQTGPMIREVELEEDENENEDEDGFVLVRRDPFLLQSVRPNTFMVASELVSNTIFSAVSTSESNLSPIFEQEQVRVVKNLQNYRLKISQGTEVIFDMNLRCTPSFLLATKYAKHSRESTCLGNLMTGGAKYISYKLSPSVILRYDFY